MSTKVGEQITEKGHNSPYLGGGPWRRYAKKYASRRFRRMGRRMLEDAPKQKRYDGWTL